jgi:hypothetical protein
MWPENTVQFSVLHFIARKPAFSQQYLAVWWRPISGHLTV